MYVGVRVKYRFLDIYVRISSFLDRFSKNIEIKNFMNIRPVGAKLFHVDKQKYGQT